MENKLMSQEEIEELLRNAGQVDDPPAPAVDLDLDSYFSRDEQDALGEMGNICMGTAATTMYTLLGKKVTITTPYLTLHTWETLAAEHPLPLVVVEVKYIEGISGNNLLLLKEYDVALITDLLMGGSGNIDPDNIVLDEICMSAIREVMNQMVGSSATSMATLLGKTINISTPSSKRILLADEQLSSIFENKDDKVLKIGFKMEIEGLLVSEIMQILPIDFAMSIAKGMLNPGADEPAAAASPAMSADNVHLIEKANYLDGAPAPTGDNAPAYAGAYNDPAPTPAQQPAPQQPAMPDQQPAAPYPSQQPAAPYPPQQPAAPYPPQQPAAPYPPQQPYPPYPPQDMGAQYPQGYPPYPYQYPYPPYGYPQQPYPPYPAQEPAGRPLVGGNLKDPSTVNVKDADYPVFGAKVPGPDGTIDTQSLYRLLDVPMEVTVELGRCSKTIKQVLDLNVGSVVVLDKLAGELVEILVNGIQIARGEVVVIDDSYGVRITELNAVELAQIAKEG